MLLRQLMRMDNRMGVYLEKLLGNFSQQSNLSKGVEESVVRNLTNEFPKEEERNFGIFIYGTTEHISVSFQKDTERSAGNENNQD